MIPLTIILFLLVFRSALPSRFEVREEYAQPTSRGGVEIPWSTEYG